MSDAPHARHGPALGAALLAVDLTTEQLQAAPVLTSIDALLVELPIDEDAAFGSVLGLTRAL